jgi:hypothetical protein
LHTCLIRSLLLGTLACSVTGRAQAAEEPVPPATSASKPVPAPSGAPLPAPARRIRDARVVLSAESVAGVWFYSSKDISRDAPDSTLRALGFDVLGSSELGVDFLFGSTSIWTVGGQGYLKGDWGSSGEASFSNRSFAIMPRGGLILGNGEPFGLWLRAGVGYRYTRDDSGESYRNMSFALDPRVIFAPAPHVALTCGPELYANRGTFEGAFPRTGTMIRVRLQGGISLLL